MSGVNFGTVLQPALQPVFDKLFKLGEDLFFKLIGWGLADAVKKWKDDLKMIQAVLVDAERKQYSNNYVETWLRDLKDVAYDMEDVLELLAIQAQEDESKTLDDKFLDFLVDTATNLGTLFGSNDQSIEGKIADITQRLENIQKQIPILQLFEPAGMQQQTFQTEALRNHRQTSSMTSEPKIFGRDDMKQKIIIRLLRDNHDDDSDKNYVMIPIVGAGGIGKTTLVQHVCNDKQVKEHFDRKAWVCVSDVFDVKHITTSIIKKFDADAAAVEFIDLDQAQERLMQLLMGNKFLIVLDDIWNEENQLWDNLKAPFRYAAKGSRVIMTTRIEKIARMMNTNSKHKNIIKLKGLSGDACWNIVQQHANNKTELVEMRADIISKCDGSPLAAKVFGGILKTKDIRECQQMLKSDLWSVKENKILPVLRLSYYDLPSHLKRVFAYCSIFPKDSTLKKMEVVLLWMAQGFLPDRLSDSMETIGENYLHELVQRSLLEVDSSSQERFIMHDLIHDMALWAAGDIFHVMDTKDISKVTEKSARHVFIAYNASTSLGIPFPQASQLRTLDCYNASSIESLDFIQKFSCIRALMLSSNKVEELLECIGDLKLLRLLRLKVPRLKKLPNSLSNLWNLQTLWLEGCSELEKVPYVGSLKKLRFFDIDCTSLQEMPGGIGKLTNLQSLGGFVLGNGHGSRVGELKNLNYLQGKLTISRLEEVSNAEDAKDAQLHKKDGLHVLYLEWRTCDEQVDDDNTQGDVLEQLKPPTSIKACNLVGYMGSKLPSWLGDPSFTNMVAIELTKLEKCKELPPLGQLPHLELLDIYSMGSIKQVGAEFYGDLIRCSNAFPALKYLEFGMMPSWEKWVHPAVENGRAFAKLKRLKIKGDCDLLEGELPPHLPHLKTLGIRGCKEMSISLGSLPSLVKLVVSDCEKIIITSGDSCALAYLTHLPQLTLEIRECKETSISLGSLPSLVDLEVSCCEKLIITSEDSCEIAHLTKLKITSCQDLVLHFPEVLHLPALEDVEISDCKNLESCPSQIHNFSSNVNLKNMKVVDCPNLTSLSISDCPNLESLAGKSTSLKVLDLTDCPKLHSLPHHLFFNLTCLILFNLGTCTNAVEHIPGPDIVLPFLLVLYIKGFQNLKSISCYGLPKVNSLQIRCCPKFESFSDNALPPNIKEVEIEECELIKPHLKRDPHGLIRMDDDRYSLC